MRWLLMLSALALLTELSLSGAYAGQAEAQVLVERFNLRTHSAPSRDHPRWRAPKKVLVLGASSAEIRQLRDSQPSLNIVAESWPLNRATDYGDVDAVIGSCNQTVLERVPNVRWIHGVSAGVDKCSSAEPIRSGRVVVTNSQRIFGPQVADHAMALLLALTRHIPHSVRSQESRRWNRGGQQLIELEGKTMLIAGLGGIGVEIARRAKAFGMRVTATRNSSRNGPEFVDYVGLSDELLTLAGQADVVVNVLPLTSETTGLFDRKFFSAMKQGGYFINVGRGASVATLDLQRALVSGRLAGAGLDVTDPEPLPENHPLWTTPNTLITPHRAGASLARRTRRWTIIEENLRRYVSGEPLLSVVDPDKAY